MSQTEVQLIKDSVIVNADISGSAAIAASKISGTVSAATTSTNVTVADESTDTTCFLLFATAATGDLPPKSGSNLTFNSNTGVLTATSFAGDGSNLTGVTSVGGANGVDFNDDVKARFGTGNDLEIFHDASDSIISDGGTGNLLIKTNGPKVGITTGGGTEIANFVNNGKCELFHSGTSRFETTSTGVTVTGNQTITGTSGADALSIQFTDANSEGFTCIGGSSQGRTNINVQAGNASSGSITAFRLKNSSGTSIGSFMMDNSTDDISLFNASQGGTISFHTSASTNSSGSLARWRFNDGGSFVPVANNAYNLGGPSNRVANIFTNDLNLSNEGSSNDIDGTWGDWTIQEGESDLFLKNNRSGKKFKFNLTEVS